LDDWATSDFSPVPLKVTIDSIKNLFKPINFQASDDYGIPEGVNITFLRNLFDEMEFEYCLKYLQLSEVECQETLSGVHC